MIAGILEKVREAAKKAVLFKHHAIEQMTSPDRMISQQDVLLVIQNGEVIEDYPNDPRGHSCLLLGTGEGGRTIHVVCSPKQDHLTIITSYVPEKDLWHEGFRKRRLI